MHAVTSQFRFNYLILSHLMTNCKLAIFTCSGVACRRESYLWYCEISMRKLEKMPNDSILDLHGASLAGRASAFGYLRGKYPRFVYERFTVDLLGDALRVKFHFRLDPDIEFAPETIFEGVDRKRFAS